MNLELETITNELFSRNAIEVIDDPTTDELYDSLKEKANEVIERFGWNDVFESWKIICILTVIV